MAVLFNLVVLAKTIGHPGLLFPSHAIFYIVSGHVGSTFSQCSEFKHFSPLVRSLLPSPGGLPQASASSLRSQAPPVVHGAAPCLHLCCQLSQEQVQQPPPWSLYHACPVWYNLHEQPTQPCDNADQTTSLPFSVFGSFPSHSRGLGSGPRPSPFLLLPYLSSWSDHIGTSIHTRNPFLLQGISTAIPAAWKGVSFPRPLQIHASTLFEKHHPDLSKMPLGPQAPSLSTCPLSPTTVSTGFHKDSTRHKQHRAPGGMQLTCVE